MKLFLFFIVYLFSFFFQFSQSEKLKTTNFNLLQVDFYEMEERIRDLTEENYELRSVITNAKQVTEKVRNTSPNKSDALKTGFI